MGRTAIKRQIEPCEAANASAALIVLADPQRYPGGLQEWAQMVAYRMVTTDASRYPALTEAWARIARDLAFNTDSNRHSDSEEDLTELAALRAWNPR